MLSSVYVLKRNHSTRPYLTRAWNYTNVLEDALKFDSHHEAMQFIVAHNAGIDPYGDIFNAGDILRIVAVREKAVTVYEWAEV